jgi:hypothetical protein
MNDKPILYLDVDGVLYYYRDDAPHALLSPYISEFFYEIIKGQFELRMLTANPQGGMRILQSLRHSGSNYCFIPDNVPFVFERSGFRNALPRDDYRYNKISFVDFSRKFVWLEDGISEKEQKILDEKGLTNNYYYVDNTNREALANIIIWLKGHEFYNEHEDTQENPAWRDHPQCSSIIKSTSVQA